MGGPSYYPPPPAPRDHIKDHLDNFYRAKTTESQQQHLTEALAEYEKQRVTSGFIDRMLGASEKKVVKVQLKDVEIEHKLALPFDIKGGLEKTLLGLKVTHDSRFIRDNKLESGNSVNTYFGTEQEERFVVIEDKKGSGWHIKIKGQSTPYSLGIPGEEHVLRRTEVMEKISTGDTNLLSLAETLVTACTPTAVRNLGGMNKTKATEWVFERNTGRVYSVVLSQCLARGRQPLVQLEIEYAGHIPGFRATDIEDERTIVQEILDVSKLFQTAHGLTPTVLTKFDWLVGKEETSPSQTNPPPKKRGKILKGQSFFDRTV